MRPAVWPYRPTSGFAASPSRLRLRQGVVRALALLVVVLFLIGTTWQSVFKNLAGFAVFAMIFAAMAAGPILNFGARSRIRVLMASLAFVAYGMLILGLSGLKIFQIDATLPVRSEYLLRQAYFLFLWIPFLLGAAGFWTALGPDIAALCRRWAVSLLVMLAVADLSTSLVFGNADQLVSVGYLSYLDKFGFQFVFSLIYLIYVSHTRRWLLCLLLITGYAAASKLLNAGIMFNATTGAIFYLFLMTSTIPLVSRRLQAKAVVVIYLALIVFLAVGVLFPDLFAQDNNDEWRLMAWRSNFVELWRSGFAGVGFGTPYFSLTANNLLNSLSNQFNSVSADLSNPINAQYVRAQHSSLVNMFYRTGLVGGTLFLYLNILIARIGFASVKHPDPAVARMAYAAFVLFIMQAVQMTVHVGLETPIFLSIYMLSVALILHVNSLAATMPIHHPTRQPWRLTPVTTGRSSIRPANTI